MFTLAFDAYNDKFFAISPYNSNLLSIYEIYSPFRILTYPIRNQIIAIKFIN